MDQDTPQQDFFDKLADLARDKKLASWTILRFNRSLEQFEVIDKLDKVLSFDEFRKKYRAGKYQFRANAKGGGLGAYEHEYNVADQDGGDAKPDMFDHGMRGTPPQQVDVAAIAAAAARGAVEAMAPMFEKVLTAVEKKSEQAQRDPIADLCSGFDKLAQVMTATDRLRDACTARDRQIKQDVAEEIADEIEDESDDEDEDSGDSFGLKGLVKELTPEIKRAARKFVDDDKGLDDELERDASKQRGVA